MIESDASSEEFRKNWARLIQKIYNVDPLLCPKCFGSMRIIAFIDVSEIVKKIMYAFTGSEFVVQVYFSSVDHATRLPSRRMAGGNPE